MASRSTLGIAFGILAIVCPAVARGSIVYGAPAPGTGFFSPPMGPGQLNTAEYDLDLNGDGHADLIFSGVYIRANGPLVEAWRTGVDGASGVQFTEEPPSAHGPLAGPIAAGALVGPGTALGPNYSVLLADAETAIETGVLVQSRYGDPAWSLSFPGPHYLGFSFVSTDGTHYGWVDLTVENVNAWAYESVPGTPIVVGAVPEPAGGALVLAAPLLLVRCRKAWDSTVRL